MKKLKEQATEQASKLSSSVAQNLPAQLDNTIKSDVEEYILNTFPWHFNRLTIKDEFKEVIYDTNANPGNVRRQLEELNTDYFTNLLTQRGDLNEAKVKEISGDLESIRTEVLE